MIEEKRKKLKAVSWAVTQFCLISHILGFWCLALARAMQFPGFVLYLSCPACGSEFFACIFSFSKGYASWFSVGCMCFSPEIMQFNPRKPRPKTQDPPTKRITKSATFSKFSDINTAAKLNTKTEISVAQKGKVITSGRPCPKITVTVAQCVQNLAIPQM